uniref:Uncharacterized protein n=1 Tax=Plectus sambesii TaxID=2011161 RepID=A0A914UPJ7_9BILA
MATAFFRRMGGKVVEYWKNIGNDYWIVTKETAENMKKSKIKSAIVISGLGGLLYAYKTNPTQDHFWESLALARHQLVLTPETIRNARTSKEVRARTEYLNQKRLAYYNCVFFSLITAKPFGEDCSLYETHCKSLKPSLFDLPRRIVDIGAFNRWLLLDKALVDLDVSSLEWVEHNQELQA